MVHFLFADIRQCSLEIAGFAVTFAVKAANKSSVLLRVSRALMDCAQCLMLVE
jgi:hypothetical protein